MPRAAESAPSEFARAVTEKIKQRMEERDRNQASVARLSGLSQNYLSERLRGVKSFTLSDIEALGRALDFDPSDFLCGIQIDRDNVTPLTPRSTDVGGAAEDSPIDEPLAAGSRGDVADPEITDA